MSLDSRFIIRETKRRLAGEMSDAEWADFQSMVALAEREYIKGPCQCEGKGWLSVKNAEGYHNLCACLCDAGKNLPPFFFPSDKDKERPLKLQAISSRPVTTDRACGRDRAFKD